MPFSMRAIGRPLLYWRAMESHAGEAPVAPAPLQIPASGRRRPNLDELFRSALFLGVIGFGGGLSVLANIESHVVTKKRWLTDKEFSNAVTVSQMLPGGAAANAIAYIGLRFGGWRGALLSYGGFCLPGFITVLVLGWGYTRFGTTPNADVVLGGFNAAVVGIIASITLKMVRTAVSRLWQMGVAAVALLFSAIGNAPPGEIVLGAIGVGLAVDLGTKRARLASVRRRRKTDLDPPVVLPEEGHPLGDEPEPPTPTNGTLRSPALVAFAGVVLAAAHATAIDADLV